MDIQSKRGGNKVMPRQPDMRSQASQARKRLNDLSGNQFPSSSQSPNSVQQMIMQLMRQLLAQLQAGNQGPNPRSRPCDPARLWCGHRSGYCPTCLWCDHRSGHGTTGLWGCYRAATTECTACLWCSD